jgi:flagellar hook assembly protein FlgD
MARRRTMDRKTLREQADAAEAREKDEDEVVEEEEEEEEAEEGDSSDDDSGDDEDAPKAKKAKKKAEPKAKKAPAKRTRAVKEVRMKAIWVVFDNGTKRIKEFPYSQKATAEAFLAEKQGDEKKGTYYLQLVKEPLEA